jgi:hypothetical protein
MNNNSQPDTFKFDLSPDSDPCPESVDAKALLDELSGILFRFVVLPKWAPETLALWILQTYAFRLRDVSTYIGIESPEKRCGKTTLLAVLSKLVSRPIAAANISSPACFRLIEETQPTSLIDEADTLLHSNERLRGILNAGYSRETAFVVRVAHPSPNHNPNLNRNLNPNAPRDPNTSTRAQDFGPGTLDAGPRTSRLARFSCWCPKVMAAIGRLPDTLADRCILIRMQRKTASEQCERLRDLEASALLSFIPLLVLAMLAKLAHGSRSGTTLSIEIRGRAPAGLPFTGFENRAVATLEYSARAALHAAPSYHS